MYLHGLEEAFGGVTGPGWQHCERGEKSLMLVTMEGGSGDDQDVSDPRRKKKYHRHTARQIQQLEAMFKECPHPDEKQRLQLSRELGLEPRQIKFWFQNRRTQMKAQHERADNCALRAENDKIRCENIAIREALKNVICPSCGPPVGEDIYFDEQKLRMENARLKEELDRVSSIAAKYIGRPVPQLPPVQPVHLSSLDLTVGGFGSQQAPGLSLDLDLLPGSSLGGSFVGLPVQSGGVAELEKSFMVEVATNAMEEFIRMSQMEEPLWVKSVADGREILNLEVYERMFSRPSQSKAPDVRTEASKDSGLVIMNGMAFVDVLVDANKWAEMFPTIISRARTVDVLTAGMSGSRNGSLQLMYAELQVLSPLVSTREFYFLRYCQQHGPATWAVVDVSVDCSKENQFSSPLRCRKLPSGVWIQDMPNGYSKITWIEHVEIEERSTVHRIYRDLVHSGLAFGAQRCLATLQRMCERYASLMMSNISARELGGARPSHSTVIDYSLISRDYFF
ncbi:unnamed protein product [Victoria cruziana]